MLSKKESKTALQKFLKKQRIANIMELFTILKTTSRMSVFRRLNDMSYISSYTHAGKYYTLSYIPHFDLEGLWFYEDVGFSKSGNLKETVIQLVNQSKVGMTHKELENRLLISVHNTLLDLVKTNKIERVNFHGVYLYISKDSKRQENQITRRQAFKNDFSKTNTLPDWVIIEILIEMIRRVPQQRNSQKIASQLIINGIMVTPDQIEQILVQHFLPKTLVLPLLKC